MSKVVTHRALWLVTLSCAGAPPGSAMGTVRVGATTMSGTFDVTFADGHLEGDFSAVGCAPPSPNGSDCNQ